MTKRWTMKDDQFLAEFHEIGADFIASHDLGFADGAGEKRITKLKEAGVWEKIIAHREALTELNLSWNLAFGCREAKEIAADEIAKRSEVAV